MLWLCDNTAGTVVKGAMYELRGYSAITHLALKIRSSVKKTLLIKRINRGFQLLLVSHQDLTSNCHEADKFEFEIIVPTTRSKYENYKLS